MGQSLYRFFIRVNRVNSKHRVADKVSDWREHVPRGLSEPAAETSAPLIITNSFKTIPPDPTLQLLPGKEIACNPVCLVYNIQSCRINVNRRG